MSDGVKLILFSAGVLAAAYGLSFVFELPLFLLLLLTFFFTCYTALLNWQLGKSLNDENKNKFTQVFMGLTGIKIFSSLILLALVLFFTGQNKLHIGICIMSYYMLYTTFEVVLWRGKLTKN